MVLGRVPPQVVLLHDGRVVAHRGHLERGRVVPRMLDR